MFYIVDEYGFRMKQSVAGSTIAEEYFTLDTAEEAESVIWFYFDMGYGDKFGIVNQITGATEWMENDEQ